MEALGSSGHRGRSGGAWEGVVAGGGEARAPLSIGVPPRTRLLVPGRAGSDIGTGLLPAILSCWAPFRALRLDCDPSEASTLSSIPLQFPKLPRRKRSVKVVLSRRIRGGAPSSPCG